MDGPAHASDHDSRVSASVVVDGLTRVCMLRCQIASLGAMNHDTPESRDELLWLTSDLAESGREACTLVKDERVQSAAFVALRNYLNEWDELGLLEEQRRNDDAYRRTGEIAGLSDHGRMRPVRVQWEAIEASLRPAIARARAALNRRMDDLFRRKRGFPDLEELKRVGVEEQAAQAEFADAIKREPKPGKQRRRGGGQTAERPPTPKQTEAVMIVGECGGNISKAARKLGQNRKTTDQNYKAGLRKVGLVYAQKIKTAQRAKNDRAESKDRGPLPSMAGRPDPLKHHARNGG